MSTPYDDTQDARIDDLDLRVGDMETATDPTAYDQTQDALLANHDTRLTALESLPDPASAQTGDVKLAYRTDNHDGWLLMNGSTFSSTEHPELYALLGATTLPNMQDRFPIGATATLSSVGTVGGSEFITNSNLPDHTHVLGGQTGDNNQNHTHTIPNHSHVLDVTDGMGSGASAARGKTGPEGINGATSGGGGGTTSAQSQNHTHPLPNNTGGKNGTAGAAYWPRNMRLGFFIHV